MYLDWERDVFSRDVVILEANESAIGTFGFGFIERALEELERAPRLQNRAF